MTNKTRIGLIFDDGFAKSSLATAKLFEEFGLRAAFAVLGNPAGFSRNPVGDFALWNELRARGHLIHPHGFTHANLQSMDYPAAISELEQCFDIFQQKLRGFEPSQAVYCFAYNASTPALCQWLLGRVGAVRTGGSGMLDHTEIQSRTWHSRAYGPEDPGTDLMDHVSRARRDRPAALLYCLHGLDGEGWGAIERDHLRRVLSVVTSDPELEYWPIAPLQRGQVI